MSKKMLMIFLKDRIPMTIGFFLNSAFILLFFYLTIGKEVEFVYPVILSTFIYTGLMLWEWSLFYRFQGNIEQSVENMGYDMEVQTAQQRETARVISAIHEHYVRQIGDMQRTAASQKSFISQWIHNLKTPAAVIDLILQKAERGEMEEIRLVEDIRQENHRIHNILENLLSMIRLEDFSRDYVPEPLDLAACVKRIVNDRKNQFIYHHVYPKFSVGDEQVMVLSDAKWNEVLLSQIISNAIKYSDGKGQYIYLSLEKEEKGVSLIIRDEGVGIPVYDMGRIFEPFFTGENGRRFGDATGIGLYMSRVIAERLGHVIKVTSEVGSGTTVRITYLSKV